MRTVSKDRILAGVTLLPSILLVGIFVYGFIGNTFWTSLTDWGGVGALSENPEKNYVGFYNYKDLFVGFLSSGFRQDLVNAIFYSVFLLIGAIGVGLFIAILLDNKPKAEGFFRTVFLYPMSLSFIVTGTIWRWLLAPSGGVNVLPTYVGAEPFNFRWLSSTQSILQFDWQNILSFAFNVISIVLIVIGLWLLGKRSKHAVKWLLAGIMIGILVYLFGDMLPKALIMEEKHGFNLATTGIILATIWQYSGYTMALYLAGFTGISQDLRDAAMLDGASTFNYYRHIAIPLIQPITISAIIILSHISLKMFDLIFAMTGPDNGQTGHPALNMYLTTFRANDFARGAAIAMLLFFLAALFIIPYLISSYRNKDERA
nr:sugar ABC transporter permease [uncultured Cohaesibacter sp.]